MKELEPISLRLANDIFVSCRYVLEDQIRNLIFDLEGRHFS